ncbi:MAG: hypothetical protein R3C12_25645 [Planctomycetaceae bacterium]
MNIETVAAGGEASADSMGFACWSDRNPREQSLAPAATAVTAP